jgi:hypothetical protein
MIENVRIINLPMDEHNRAKKSPEKAMNNQWLALA